MGGSRRLPHLTPAPPSPVVPAACDSAKPPGLESLRQPLPGSRGPMQSWLPAITQVQDSPLFREDFTGTRLAEPPREPFPRLCFHSCVHGT